MQICPHCHYERKPTDTAPDWECPSCGIAYAKYDPAAFVPHHRPALGRIAVEFQARRRTTWRIVWPWAIVAVAGFGVLFALSGPHGILNPETPWKVNLMYGAFLAAGVSIARISFAVKKYYRCPACDNMIMQWSTGWGGVRGGVPVDPEVCSSCGARLK